MKNIVWSNPTRMSESDVLSWNREVVLEEPVEAGSSTRSALSARKRVKSTDRREDWGRDGLPQRPPIPAFQVEASER